MTMLRSPLNMAAPVEPVRCNPLASGARRLARALPVAVVLLAALVVAVLAQAGLTFPTLSGRVVDDAAILSPAAREALETKLKAHEDKTSDQVVVATVRSLQGTSIEDYANQLFRQWKLGQAKTNNGVLVLVAPNERKVRVEVGYGLEGTLTDAISRMIIQAAIAPKFKQGDYAAGLEGGVDAIVATLQGDNEWQDRYRQRNQQPDAGYNPMVIFMIIVMIFIIINIIASRRQVAGRGSGGRAHRRSDGGWIVIPTSGGWGSPGGGFGGGGFGGGGFSGGGGSSGGGGASGDW